MTAPAPPTIAQILTEWHADKDAALRLADENCAAARQTTSVNVGDELIEWFRYLAPYQVDTEANGKSERPTREITDDHQRRS